MELRAERAKIEAEVPSTVLIGTYLLHTSTLKTMLLEKFERTCQLLMKLICERGREQAAEVAKAFSDMYDMLQEQPKDIEKLTEISEFMSTLTENRALMEYMTDRLIEAETIDYDELQAMTEAHVNGQDLKQLQAA